MKASFFYTLRRFRFSIVGWGIGLWVLAILLAYIITIFEDQREMLQELLQALPKEILAFAKMDANEAISPKTFLDGRYFTFMPLILGIFAALSGSGLLAHDEETGRLDLMMAHPISRRTLFVSRLAAFVVVLIGILVIGWIGLSAGLWWIAIDIPPLDLLLPYASLFAVVLLTASIGLMLSMILPARRLAGMMTALILIASFLMNGFAEISDNLVIFAQLLPLYYHQGTAAIDRFNVSWFAGLMTASAACLVIAYWRFEKRDIRVAGEGVLDWKKVAVGAVLVLALLGLFFAIAMQHKRYDSPENVFDASMIALNKEDWPAFQRCLTPPARKKWNAALLVHAQGAALLRSNPTFLDRLLLMASSKEQMVKQYSMAAKFRVAMKYVDPNQLQQNQGLIRSLYARRSADGHLQISDPQTEKLAAALNEPDEFLVKALKAWAIAHHYRDSWRITNLNTTGNAADADLVAADGEITKITFQKIDGSWHIHLPFLPGEPRKTIGGLAATQ